MFQRMIDDFKDSISTTARLTSLATAAALALTVAISFLCAAAFIYVLQKYGSIEACLTGAGIFFVVTLVVAATYIVRKRRIRVQPKEAAKDAGKSALHSAFADPMLVATGLQLVRAIGIKRLIPILAVGGLALGIIASRGAASAPDDEAPEN